MAPLDPQSVVRVYCSVCSWQRAMDFTRDYRGGHTNPENLRECTEMIRYEQISEFPPEVVFLGNETGVPQGEELSAEQMQVLDDYVFEAEGSGVDEVVAFARNKDNEIRNNASRRAKAYRPIETIPSVANPEIEEIVE